MWWIHNSAKFGGITNSGIHCNSIIEYRLHRQMVILKNRKMILINRLIFDLSALIWLTQLFKLLIFILSLILILGLIT